MSEIEKYYQVLGLKPGASEKEIIEAYKVLVKVWSPVRFPDDPHIQKIATEKIKEIDEAFKQLLIWAGSPPEKVKEIPEPELEVKTDPHETKGSIVIQTEPEEAVITINGEPVGISRYERVDLPPGLYKVRATLQGHEVWEHNVLIGAGAKQEVIAKLKLKEPESGQIWKDPYLGMEFVYVKGGVFQMGDIFGDGNSDEKPVHEVRLNAFWIGKYLVTQQQWKGVVGNNPSRVKHDGDYPVEQVNWYDVEKFISRLNQETGMDFRLPTEAEWEYAARSGGKIEKWAGTSNESDLGEYAWYLSNSIGGIHPVGQKRPNGLGLFDMTGNVWEWVQDWYGREYYNESPKNNPQGPENGVGRVLRGGSVNSLPVKLRVTTRTVSNAEEGRDDTGFRLVLPAQVERPLKKEKEQPIASEDKSYRLSLNYIPPGTPPPSQQEPLYEPSSKVLVREDLKPGIEQTVASPHIVKYAGFWKRFVALLIDSILIYIATFMVTFIFGLSIGLSGGRTTEATVTVWIIAILFYWFYWALMESSSKQATFGKMALGIIVTDYEGKRISFGRATGRNWAKIISGLILLIGYTMAGFTEKKQALHDMIAECLVVVKQ